MILLRSLTASPSQRGNWGFPQQPAQGTKAQLSRGKQWRCLSTPVLRRDRGGGVEGWSLSEAKVPARAFWYSRSLIGYQSYNQGGAVLEEEEVVTAVFSLGKR